MSNVIRRAVRRPSRAALRAVTRVQRLRRGGDHHITIVCAPKSGSTFLIELLLEVTGFERRNPLAAGDRHENNLYEPALIDAIGSDSVAQVHTLASEHNLELLRRYGHTAVVLNRDLADTAVSLRDHLVQEGTRWPMMWADERFHDLDPAEQLDQVIDLAMPWFVNFHVSWTEAIASGEVAPVRLAYADLVADPHGTLGRICTHAGLGVDDRRLEDAVSLVLGERNIRRNVGRSGRGRETLSDAQLERLGRLVSHYPWVDWGPVWPYRVE